MGIKSDPSLCEEISHTLDEQMKCYTELKIKPPADFCFYKNRFNRDTYFD